MNIRQKECKDGEIKHIFEILQQVEYKFLWAKKSSFPNPLNNNRSNRIHENVKQVSTIYEILEKKKYYEALHKLMYTLRMDNNDRATTTIR